MRGPHEGGARLRVEHAGEHVEIVPAQPRVGVQQQHVGGAPAGDAGVAARGEPAVLGHADHVHRQAGDRGAGVVAGGVVHHGHGHPREAGQGLHASAEGAGAVVGHHHHVDRAGLRPARRQAHAATRPSRYLRRSPASDRAPDSSSPGGVTARSLGRPDCLGQKLNVLDQRDDAIRMEPARDRQLVVVHGLAQVQPAGHHDRALAAAAGQHDRAHARVADHHARLPHVVRELLEGDEVHPLAAPVGLVRGAVLHQEALLAGQARPRRGSAGRRAARWFRW